MDLHMRAIKNITADRLPWRLEVALTALVHMNAESQSALNRDFGKV